MDTPDADRWNKLIDDLWQANPMSRLLPFSPGEVSRAVAQVWLDALKNPERGVAAYADFVAQSTQIWTNAALQMWGVAAKDPPPPTISPEPGDRRFNAPDWQRNAAFDALKQSYLLGATSLLKSAAEVEGLDRAQQRKIQFYLRQFVDAISPTNSLFTNPPRSSTKPSRAAVLVDQGFSVFVISWKNPDASMEDTTFDDYLELGPLAALDVVKKITGSATVNPVGYCIGGTLLSMTLPYLAAIGDTSVNVATFLVALQDFSEVGDTAVFIDEPQVAYIEQQMLERGYLDSRSMATMFNMLRANDLIWSNVVNNYLLGKDPPAFDLLYWNADGTRMARAAHTFYLRNTYLENNLIEPGRVSLKGVPIDLGEIRQDIYAVGTEQDHIVPWRSAWRITQLARGNSRFVVGGRGHIAGVINPPTRGRGYWLNPQSTASADAWMAGATRHEGSWWSDWLA